MIDAATERLCPDCGYDLRGIASERCPECGLDLSTFVGCRIPWEYRVQIGRAKAFARTVGLATFSPRRLGTAAAGPVDERAARRYRWLVVTLAAAAPSLALLAVIWHKGGTAFLDIADFTPSTVASLPPGHRWELPLIWSAGATLAPVIPIGIFVTLLLATLLTAYWFTIQFPASERRGRAGALACYACGPLALFPIAVFAWAAAAALAASDAGQVTPMRQSRYMLIGVCCLVTALAVGAFWWSTLQLLRSATHCGGNRLLAAAVGVPVAWFLSIVVGLGLLPALIGLAWIAIDSLR